MLFTGHLKHTHTKTRKCLSDHFCYCSCYFDGVKGKVTNTFFTTVTLLLVLVMNMVLYFLTWLQIRKESEQVKKSFGPMPASMRASHRAAKAMSLFVIAFFIQWWAMAFYGIWQLATDDIPPQVIFHFVTTFSNIGGCLNLAVFIIIHRQQLSKGENMSTEQTKSKSSRSCSREHSTNDSQVCGPSIDMTIIDNHLAVPAPTHHHHQVSFAPN